MKSWAFDFAKQAAIILMPYAVLSVVGFLVYRHFFGSKSPSTVALDTLDGIAGIPSGLASLINDKVNGFSESDYITQDQQKSQTQKALAAKNAVIAAGGSEAEAMAAMRAAIGA